MEVIKIVGVSIFAVIMIIILKNYRPEMALVLSIITGIGIMLYAISKMSSVINVLNDLVSKSGVNTDFLLIIIKVIGIAYIVEFGKNVCIDAGQSSIATKLEMAGKVVIVVLTIPLISSLVNVLVGLV
ncbi:MAG: stage III sporulation protein AD [Clostridia bacterium]|jgi:stage III sporulation protein AD|nr:stage III sporulation protein AD [Clostridia bacterium]CDC78558.1 stage iii sporulation protein ad putative [Clostridium sp. CAG:465]